MVTVRYLLAIASVKGWFTCQMDVSNAFLHGDLFEEVYMKPPLGYTGKGHNVCVDSKLDSQLSKTDYSLFVKNEGTSFTDVLIYGIFISQHKYTKELLKEGEVMHNKPYKLPMEPNLKLQADVGTPLQDPEVYRRFIRKLIYFTVIRPDICYTVKLLSQFMQSPTSIHMQAVKHLLSCLVTRRSTKGYCILLGDSPISWKSKKQAVVSRSSAEAEYRAMALTCCEVTWLVSLFKDLGIKDLEPVDLFCDNQAAMYIAANPVFHARTKHIEVDCHYVRDQLKAGKINPSYAPHGNDDHKRQIFKILSSTLATLAKQLRLYKPPSTTDDHDDNEVVSEVGGGLSRYAAVVKAAEKRVVAVVMFTSGGVESGTVAKKQSDQASRQISKQASGSANAPYDLVFTNDGDRHGTTDTATSQSTEELRGFGRPHARRNKKDIKPEPTGPILTRYRETMYLHRATKEIGAEKMDRRTSSIRRRKRRIRVSLSSEDSSDNEDAKTGHWKSKNKYREDKDEDMSRPWRRQKVDAFTRRISDFSEDKKRRMPANVKTYDGTGDLIHGKPETNAVLPQSEVKLQEPWILFTDGSSCVDGSGAGLILTNPEGMEFTYALRFEFTATNNEAEYEALIAGLRIAARMGVRNLEANVDSRLVANHVLGEYVAKEDNMIQYLDKTKSLIQGFDRFTIRQVPRGDNKKADALSKIASTSFAHLSKQVLVEILKNKSISEMEISTVIEEQDPTWMTPIIKFISKGTLLYEKGMPGEYAARRRDSNFEMVSSIDVRPRSVVARALRSGYYWPTMHRDARDMIKKCNDCQVHRPIPRQPQQELTPITSPWPFHKWGIDIAGPFPVAAGRIEFDVVVEELSQVLWAQRTTINVSTRGHSLSLVYGTERGGSRGYYQPVIGMQLDSYAEVNIATNDDERRIDLDILEERREQAAIRRKKQNTGKLGQSGKDPTRLRKALGKEAYKLRDMENGRELPAWNFLQSQECYL
ncbi:reverse transcriptase domain-containing protein [Tanacetum coccineum]